MQSKSDATCGQQKGRGNILKGFSFLGKTLHVSSEKESCDREDPGCPLEENINKNNLRGYSCLWPFLQKWSIEMVTKKYGEVLQEQR